MPGYAMTICIMGIAAVLVAITAWAFHDFQLWLEARDYRRHCND